MTLGDAVGAEAEQAGHAVDVDERGVTAAPDGLGGQRSISARATRSARRCGLRAALTTPPPSLVKTTSGCRSSEQRRPGRRRGRHGRTRATTSRCCSGVAGKRGRRASTALRARDASWRAAAGDVCERGRDLVERVAEHVVQDERDPLVGRQALEHDQQREARRPRPATARSSGSGSAPRRSARAATVRRRPRAARARSAARPARAARPSSSATPRRSRISSASTRCRRSHASCSTSSASARLPSWP